ncbi:MAG: PilN domain-containing protein [bacterium]|nr:PilN domain-containing protein [bacterium]
MAVRINLLTPELLAKKEAQRRNIISGLLVVIFAGLMVGIYMERTFAVNGLEDEIKQVDRRMDDLKDVLAEIERLKKEDAMIKRRIDIINQLIKDRLIWAHVLDEMSNSIPPDLWLTDSVNAGGNNIELSGVAMDNFAIANLMVNLEGNDYFSSVELIDIKRSEIDERDVKNFQIKFIFKS